MSTIFKKIIDGEIQTKIVFEDELCLAFHDINPQAPVHILVIPKKEIPSLKEVEENDRLILGHLLWAASQIAQKEHLSENGYRTVINTGEDGGQSVHHLHVHLLGGRAMSWPPG